MKKTDNNRVNNFVKNYLEIKFQRKLYVDNTKEDTYQCGDFIEIENSYNGRIVVLRKRSMNIENETYFYKVESIATDYIIIDDQLYQKVV